MENLRAEDAGADDRSPVPSPLSEVRMELDEEDGLREIEPACCRAVDGIETRPQEVVCGPKQERRRACSSEQRAIAGSSASERNEEPFVCKSAVSVGKEREREKEQ